MAVTLPVVLLILDVYPFERAGIRGLFTNQWRLLVEKVPFFALSIVSSVLTLQAQEAGGALIHFKSQLLVGRVLVALRSLMFYLYKMVWPAELVPFYPYSVEVSLVDIQYLGSVVLVAGITVFSIWMWRRQKVWAAVWLYYVVSLFPVLGIVQVGGQAAADRYTYMPGLGPFLLVGIGVAFLKELALKRWSRGIKEKPDEISPLPAKIKTTLITLFLLVISVIMVLTVKQERIWKDSFALWNTELRSFPQVSIAYRNLGAAYGVKEDFEAALKNFTRAIELNPVDPLSFYNRGIIYGKSGLHDKAIDDLQEAIRLDPLSAKFYNNLGVAYGISGNFQEAITSFDRAVELDPSFGNAYFHRGVTYIRLGFNENAFKDFRSAAQLGDAGAQNYLQTRGMRW
jgi:tetratricopeptide (TPR) repeat protein